MKIELRRIEDIRPYENNPRINDDAVDAVLDGNPIHLVNTDPPYNVKVEPRSNNAIAAGLSSFQGSKHHQKFDVERRLSCKSRTS